MFQQFPATKLQGLQGPAVIPMKIFMLSCAMALMLVIIAGPVGASQGTSVTISPPGVTLLPGSTTTYELYINTLPAGLSGFQLDFVLTNPSAAQVTKVTFPSWATGKNYTALPSGRVTISAADAGKAVEDGASGTILARVTVEAVSQGTTTIKLQNLRVDDDHGGYINPDVTTAQLVVKPGGVNVSTPVTTVSTLPTTVPGTPPVIEATLVPTPEITVETTVAESTEAGPSASQFMSSLYPSGNSHIPMPDTGSLLSKVPRWLLYGIGLIVAIASIALLILAVTKKI